MRLHQKFMVTVLFPITFFASPLFSDENATLRLTGSSTVAPVIQEIAEVYGEHADGARVFVETGGSSKGITDLRNGLSDIAMVSRDLKSEESDLVAHTFARDGIAALIQAENGVDQISQDQMIAIFKGEITNWSEIGGEDQEIVVVSKGEGSATSAVMNKFLGITADEVDGDLVAAENAQMIKTVSLTAGSIGYVSIGAATVEMEYGAKIKMIGLGEIAPTLENVTNGSYEATRPLNLVTKADVAPTANELIDFARSDDVRDIIKDLNYIQVQE